MGVRSATQYIVGDKNDVRQTISKRFKTLSNRWNRKTDLPTGRPSHTVRYFSERDRNRSIGKW